MAERVTVTREQMGPLRKTADTVVWYGNVLDVGAIAWGLITVSPPVIALGVLGLVGGNYIRDEYIRKMPRHKVVFDAKTQDKKGQHALAA